AEPGKAYLTEHTAKLVDGFVTLTDLGQHVVKGAKDSVRVYELQGGGRLRTRLEIARARGFSRFVGRAKEMAILGAALERAIAGEARIVGIVAEPGVGKSRLCHEFVERCRARGVEAFETRGASHGRTIPFLPMLEYVRGFFGVEERDDPQAARGKIAGALLRLDSSFREALPVMFEFLGVADPENPLRVSDPEARQQQLHALVRRITQMRGRVAPAVTVFEDLHWFDGGSLALLEQLMEALPGTRLLRVVNFRPGFHAPWMRRSDYQQIALLPLGAEAATELVVGSPERMAHVNGPANGFHSIWSGAATAWAGWSLGCRPNADAASTRVASEIHTTF
ncbi:MAG: AAA family ATPase, partial [Candidatus Binatia bacterium]